MQAASYFAHYMTSKLTAEEISGEEVTIYDKHHRIQSTLIYQAVRVGENYSFFSLDSSPKIAAFTKIFGEMSVAGKRRWMPKVDAEHGYRQSDAVNMTTKLEVYISTTKLRARVPAFKQIVGKTVEDDWLWVQLSAYPIEQQAVLPVARTLLITAKFDYHGRVVEANGNDGVCCQCIWGEQKEVELVFQDINEVIHLVNLQQG
jgi:hypothetical protein